MKRWHELSRNPNAPEVSASRNYDIIRARATLVYDRVDYLSKIARGKDVLDVGVVNHSSEAADNPDWLHGHLCKTAKTCLGVDILEEEVNNLKSRGFNVTCIDITEKLLDQTFDLIVCGDVIEHLDTPGRLLASAAQMLKPSGRVILSVPNPWYFNVILKNTFNGAPYIDNVDHVAWFDPCTLCELGQRYSLVLDKFAGVAAHNSLNLRTKVFFGLAPLFTRLGLRPELFAKTMIYEFVRADREYE